MNILLTGGAGYIGSHTAVVLNQAGHRVCLYDNLCNSSCDAVARVERIVGRELTFIEGDVRDATLLAEVLERQEINAVIHFAGLKAVGESVQMPVEYFDNNVGGTIALLRAMRQVGVKQLIFSSSATVYGEPQYLPIDEFHPNSATNPYGRSKLHVEELLQDLACSDVSWRIACLRYFNPVGAHVSGLIGESPRGVPNNLMPYVALVAAKKLAKLSVFGSDYLTCDGTGVRDYIHVMDLAEGHLAALDNLSSQANAFEVFNLGTGQGYSVMEIIKTFEEVSNCQISYKHAPRRVGDVPICYANAEKAYRVLGWSAKRGLREMCESEWRFRCTSS